MRDSDLLVLMGLVVVVAALLGFLGGRTSMKCIKCGDKIHPGDLR